MKRPLKALMNGHQTFQANITVSRLEKVEQIKQLHYIKTATMATNASILGEAVDLLFDAYRKEIENTEGVQSAIPKTPVQRRLESIRRRERAATKKKRPRSAPPALQVSA